MASAETLNPGEDPFSLEGAWLAKWGRSRAPSAGRLATAQPLRDPTTSVACRNTTAARRMPSFGLIALPPRSRLPHSPCPPGRVIPDIRHTPLQCLTGKAASRTRHSCLPMFTLLGVRWRAYWTLVQPHAPAVRPGPWECILRRIVQGAGREQRGDRTSGVSERRPRNLVRNRGGGQVKNQTPAPGAVKPSRDSRQTRPI